MSDAKSSRVWFITGSSSGFGHLLAKEALRRGERVIATARDASKLDDLLKQHPGTARVFTLDVTQPAEIESVAQQAIAAFGHVDVLVNNAGYGLNGAIEEVSEDEFEPMFQTNIYGLIRTTRAFLPYFRQRRSGHILNLSSISGLVGGAGWGFYNVTKFAVEGFSEALAAELKPLGIHVTVVEPGPFRTDFLGRSGKLAAKELPEYKETAGKAREYFETQSGKQPGDPQKAVEAIIAVADSPNPPLHLILGKIALTRLRDKLAQWQKETAAWESVTVGADFPEGK
ncbi:MAG: oxidoreductase [Terracidiphilus sp.]|jgi:NAD(P)-dependent dehydrogenase (short-subunit alcohol dehydrogenase family)